MKNILLTLLVLLATISVINAQDQENAITTAAPFLLITPDARSGGMGDVGVSTSPDANALHHNAAKIAFMNKQYKVGVIYTPWLRELTSDVFLGGFTVANRLNERSAWGVSFKYFSLGEIQLTDDFGGDQGTEKLNELSLAGTYALKLNETFSMAVAMRFIRSDLGIEVSNTQLSPVNTFSVDVSGYYQSEEENYGKFNGKWRGGFNLSNIGPKISYTDSEDNENFIPTNLKLGGGFDFILDDVNTIGATLEFTKLLVPTPPLRNADNEITKGKDDNVGFFKGMFQSLGDAPGGFSEEINEITWALGVEYLYDNAFALRAGYFNQDNLKGARKYYTLGTGFKFQNSTIDISYLFNSSDVKNPLENTLRFSLTFDFGDLYKDY